MLSIFPYIIYSIAVSGILALLGTLIYQEKSHIRYLCSRCNFTALPTSERCSSKVLELIKTLPSSSYRLIDIGCGEGDMLDKIHTETDIRCIIGVELYESLARTAKSRFELCKSIFVHNMDMTHYVFESTPTIVYMYEPLFRLNIDDAMSIYNNFFVNLSRNRDMMYIIYVSGVKQMLSPEFFQKYNYTLLHHCTVNRFCGLAGNNIYLYKNMI